jgi:rod shape-determining protein MreC
VNACLSRLSRQDGLEAENQRLRQALGFSSRAPYRVRPAEVIGKRTANYFSFIEINRGSASGVRVNMPVIVKEGLVGRVIEVSRSSAKVLLITDVMSTVAVVDQSSRDTGAAEGTGSDRLSMKYVSVGGEVKEGDRIVTSSFSSYFPAGIPVGTVTRAVKKESDLFFEIEIKPSMNLSRLEEVFLIL